MTPDEINSAVCRDTNGLSNRLVLPINSGQWQNQDEINQSEFALKRVAAAKRGKNENTHVMIGWKKEARAFVANHICENM